MEEEQKKEGEAPEAYVTKSFEIASSQLMIDADNNAVLWTMLRLLNEIKCNLDKSDPEESWKGIVDRHGKNKQLVWELLAVESKDEEDEE